MLFFKQIMDAFSKRSVSRAKILVENYFWLLLGSDGFYTIFGISLRFPTYVKGDEYWSELSQNSNGGGISWIKCAEHVILEGGKIYIKFTYLMLPNITYCKHCVWILFTVTSCIQKFNINVFVTLGNHINICEITTNLVYHS